MKMNSWNDLMKGPIDLSALIQQALEREHMLMYGMSKETKQALDQFDQDLKDLVDDEG
jgi:hypothetical protein